MSTPINDGGPAFPQPDVYHPSGQIQYGTPGMSLRDKFAESCPLTPESYAPVYGMEFAAILQHPEHAKVFWVLFADERYAYADAMLAARQKGTK